MTTTHAVRSMYRLLAVAFWMLGFVRASDALRTAVYPESVTWTWVDAIFGLCFFCIATILWLEAKHVGMVRDNPPTSCPKEHE